MNQFNSKRYILIQNEIFVMFNKGSCSALNFYSMEYQTNRYKITNLSLLRVVLALHCRRIQCMKCNARWRDVVSPGAVETSLPPKRGVMAGVASLALDCFTPDGVSKSSSFPAIPRRCAMHDGQC